jgi:hypothetical protein
VPNTKALYKGWIACTQGYQVTGAKLLAKLVRKLIEQKDQFSSVRMGHDVTV